MRPGFTPLLIALVAGIVSLLAGIFSSVSHPLPRPQITPNPIYPYPSVTFTPSPSPTLIPSPTQMPLPTAKPVTPTPKPVSGPPGTGLSTLVVSTPLGNFSATVLSLDLTSTRMITDTASDSDCSDSCPTLPLKDYVTRNNGFAGANGTYFCPAAYPECAGKSNSFDFPVYNSRLHKWMEADKLGWNERRAIIYTDGSGAHYQNSSAGFSGGLDAGIINYPGLVDGGSVQIDDNQSGLSDKQKSVGIKVGIGTRNPNNLLVVVAQNVNMQQFAYVFKSLGATGALNLDTGGSTALYNGGYIYGPGRSLPNAVIFAHK